MAVTECAWYWRLIVNKRLGFMPSSFLYIYVGEKLTGGSHFGKSISWYFVFGKNEKLFRGTLFPGVGRTFVR